MWAAPILTSLKRGWYPPRRQGLAWLIRLRRGLTAVLAGEGLEAQPARHLPGYALPARLACVQNFL